MLEALSRIHSEDAILLIAGEGECREELEGMVRELELDDKVIFTGNVPQEELNSYYMLSDLVVVPSITYGIGDPWVLVLNEAMYFKNPVTFDATCFMVFAKSGIKAIIGLYFFI